MSVFIYCNRVLFCSYEVLKLLYRVVAVSWLLTHEGTVNVGVYEIAIQSPVQSKVPYLTILSEQSNNLFNSVIACTTLSCVGSSPVGNLAHTNLVSVIVGESSGAL